MSAGDAIHRCWDRWQTLQGHYVSVTTSAADYCYNGVLCAIDPESGSLFLLTLPGPRLRLVMGHVVRNVTVTEGSAPCSLLGNSCAVLAFIDAQISPKSIPERDETLDHDAEAITRFLNSMRIDAKLENIGNQTVVSVLDGVAYVFKPFQASDCQSTNETVLARLRNLMESYTRL